MKSSPQEFGDNLNTIIAAWTKLAPGVKFYGRTLEEFIAEMGPCLKTRSDIADKEKDIAMLQNNRNDADVVANPIILGVVAGVRGDPNFGEDSDLYELMGYVRKSERATGLHKSTPKSSTPPA
jgi:hypothetical protein